MLMTSTCSSGRSTQPQQTSRPHRYRPIGERWSRTAEIACTHRGHCVTRDFSRLLARDFQCCESSPLFDEERAPRPVVMLIDDDDYGRRILGQILQLDGYEVLQAANGFDALRQLRGNVRPGLILLDLIMSEGDGWDFVGRQQHDPQLSTIPVIVVSAVDTIGDGLRDEYSTVVAQFQKPFAVSELLATIHHCLPLS
jgi:CheY-like chemotaxis protein